MKKLGGSILHVLTGAIIGAGAVGKIMSRKSEESKAMSDKHLELFRMMNQWVRIKQENKNLAEYFERHGFYRVAVYGMSYAGETLVDELKNTKIEVAYGIDRNADSIYSEVELFTGADELGVVDAVVVTAITRFDEIKENLRGKVNCQIISLEDVIYEV